MSNSIYCFSKTGADLGSIGQGLSCYGYAQTLCAKNGVVFEPSVEIDLLNQCLEKFYRSAAPVADKIPVLLFMNDQNKLTESDIPALKEAIAQFPTTFNQNPKKALEAYLAILEAEKEIYTRVNDEQFDSDLENYAGTADLK